MSGDVAVMRLTTEAVVLMPPSASAAVGSSVRHRASAIRQLKIRFFIGVLLWFFLARVLSPTDREYPVGSSPYGPGGAPGQFFSFRCSV